MLYYRYTWRSFWLRSTTHARQDGRSKHQYVHRELIDLEEAPYLGGYIQHRRGRVRVGMACSRWYSVNVWH
jgi:hypothetical protein